MKCINGGVRETWLLFYFTLFLIYFIGMEILLQFVCQSRNICFHSFGLFVTCIFASQDYILLGRAVTMMLYHNTFKDVQNRILLAMLYLVVE